eukprot:4845_1
MPRFAANISDGWLFKNIPFLKRIEAAAKAGFSAIEAPFPYKNDPYSVKQALDKNNIKFVLLNQQTLPEYKSDTGRFCHGIYPDEIHLFEKSLRNALDYAQIVNCPWVHIGGGGSLTDDINIETANFTFTYNLLRSRIIVAEEYPNIGLLIEPRVSKPNENYYLNNHYQTLKILDIVNNNMFIENIMETDKFNKIKNNLQPIKYQFDIFHMQRIHGHLTKLISENIDKIAYFQIANVPERYEPCNSCGEINYEYIYDLLDNKLKINRHWMRPYMVSDNASGELILNRQGEQALYQEFLGGDLVKEDQITVQAAFDINYNYYDYELLKILYKRQIQKIPSEYFTPDGELKPKGNLFVYNKINCDDWKNVHLISIFPESNMEWEGSDGDMMECDMDNVSNECTATDCPFCNINMMECQINEPDMVKQMPSEYDMDQEVQSEYDEDALPGDKRGRKLKSNRISTKIQATQQNEPIGTGKKKLKLSGEESKITL